jgi:hypothetical protein
VRAPQDQQLALELLASGVQIYECSAGEGSGRFEWKFKAPDARLNERRGSAVGIHYAGPTWEGFDGSAVVAEVRSRAPSANADAIPLLLLQAKSTRGDGIFSAVRTIQRLNTAGGSAPSDPCTERRVGQVTRVPYTATYYFYVDRR